MTNDRIGRPVFIPVEPLTDAKIEEMKETARNGGTAGIVISASADLQIIRTKEELEALDVDTVLIQHEKGDDVPYMDFQHVWLSDWAIDRANVFPLATIARVQAAIQAARAALEKENI